MSMPSFRWAIALRSIRKRSKMLNTIGLEGVCELLKFSAQVRVESHKLGIKIAFNSCFEFKKCGHYVIFKIKRI